MLLILGEVTSMFKLILTNIQVEFYVFRLDLVILSLAVGLCHLSL